jgi:putative membrane protein
MDVSQLPLVNASLNGTATILLLAGIVAVKRGQARLHSALMVAAIVVSALFLTSYLIYHFNVGTVTRFTHPGWPKAVYRFILFTHIPLAVLVLPLLVRTVLPAWRGDLVLHRKRAKLTFPVWLYVSVTGVLVYLMLYVWFPPMGA